MSYFNNAESVALPYATCVSPPRISDNSPTRIVDDSPPRIIDFPEPKSEECSSRKESTRKAAERDEMVKNYEALQKKYENVKSEVTAKSAALNIIKNS